ncbi:MAG TPA: serine hydrolase domain-containing protein [Candidatus Tyrphobacter sp.]
MKSFPRSLVACMSALALCAAAPDPRALMRAQSAPGLELVVIDHGRVVTNVVYGVRNVDTQQPVDVHTRFEIGSITKQFTAAAILQLRERGRLSLDDRLGKYVPQYRQGRDVTLRQLLMQVSGIPNYTDTHAFKRLVTLRGTTVVLSRSGTFDAILAMLDGMPLSFKPGTKWQYSNSNYILLGRVVEIASGMPWRQYVRAHIFAPAGMTESSFMDDERGIVDMATGYRLVHGHLHPTGTFNGWARSAGAIVSTASDLAKWDEALFSGKLIGAADLRRMLTSGALPALNPRSHYAFGWAVDRYDGQPRVWHNGGTLGFSASNQVYPQLGQTIIVLENNSTASADSVVDAAFERLHPQFARVANAAAPGEDPAVTARAKATLAQFLTGALDRTQLSATMNRAMTAQVIANAKMQFASLGTPVTWIFRGKTVAGGNTTYAYHVTFSTGVQLNVYMSVDAGGKISGYLLTPN